MVETCSGSRGQDTVRHTRATADDSKPKTIRFGSGDGCDSLQVVILAVDALNFTGGSSTKKKPSPACSICNLDVAIPRPMRSLFVETALITLEIEGFATQENIFFAFGGFQP